ncbi:MAG: hypothetical protein C0490_27070, partial [Marivirga sp.]|nr:hypothetical protein [Marivirga sp.]
GDSPGGKGAVSFRLHKVKLLNTKVNYTDQNAEQEHTFTSKDLIASIQTTNDIYTIEASGEVTTEKIKVNQRSFLAGKSFLLESNLIYDDIQKALFIKPSLLNLKSAQFNVSGEYRWKQRNLIDLITEAKEADIQTLLSLLPESASKNLQQYQSKGDVYFKSKLKGEISSKKSPSISIDFGFTNATLFHPQYKSRIEGASVEGSFAASDVLDVSTATLVLKNIEGTLNDEPFAANLVIQNFNNPDVICDFKGRVDAGALLGFYPIEGISHVSGSLLANVSFRGRIELLKKKATAQRVSTQGTIDLQNIALTFNSDKIALQNLVGNLQFSNNDLALSNVSGKLGNSDFTFNGFFKNIITFLLFENQPIGIETDLKSNFLDV